jgi:hypothetical protein
MTAAIAAVIPIADGDEINNDEDVLITPRKKMSSQSKIRLGLIIS